jgi:hypothetical protein
VAAALRRRPCSGSRPAEPVSEMNGVAHRQNGRRGSACLPHFTKVKGGASHYPVRTSVPGKRSKNARQRSSGPRPIGAKLVRTRASRQSGWRSGVSPALTAL